MARWINLEKEPEKRISSFAYALRENFGNQWNFTKFVDNNPKRMPVRTDYVLEDFFKERGKLLYRRFVIGQPFPNQEVIRMAFEKSDIWADFVIGNTNENYTLIDSLFIPVFGYKIEKYPYQQTQ